MNVFYEFYKIAAKLREREVEYALIGGVAMAYYLEPAITNDVDILVSHGQHESAMTALKELGFSASAAPLTFGNAKCALYRFSRGDGIDEMIVDILVAGDEQHEAVIDNAQVFDCEKLGAIRVARREDLIWLKEARNTAQDLVDIGLLRSMNPDKVFRELGQLYEFWQHLKAAKLQPAPTAGRPSRRTRHRSDFNQASKPPEHKP